MGSTDNGVGEGGVHLSIFFCLDGLVLKCKSFLGWGLSLGCQRTFGRRLLKRRMKDAKYI